MLWVNKGYLSQKLVNSLFYAKETGVYMFYISIVDFEKNFRNKAVSDCREILFNDFKMQSAICVKGSKECFLNEFGKVQNIFNIHVMFYGEDVYDILLIYRVCHFYFILKNMFNEMFPKAISKGREIIMSENKKISITNKCKTDVLNLSEIIAAKNKGRILTIETMNENFMSYSKSYFT